MTQEESFDERLAFSTFLPAIPWILIFSVIPVSIAVFRSGGGLHELLFAIGALIACVTPVMLIICLVSSATYRVRVSSEGVSSYDPYGAWKNDFVRWDDMLDIDRESVMGVPYVKILARDNATLWIPSLLFGDSSMTCVVQRIAPQSNMANWMKCRQVHQG